jgi:hypothetical protein
MEEQAMNGVFKAKMVAFYLPLVLVLLLVFSACKPDDENQQTVKPTSVEITSPSSSSLAVGSYELKATVKPEEVGQEVVFSLEQGADGVSLNENTLTVDSTATHQAQIKVRATSVADDSVFVENTYTVNNRPIWNKAPVVLEDQIFFDDFSDGVSKKYYTSSGPGRGWGVAEGERPNYMNPANISWTTDEEIVAEAGGTGGIVSMQVNGDLYPEEGRRREGTCLITKKAFGPGLYEIRFKTVPRLGAVTAFWTYWNGGGSTLQDNAYSEIDIEMPMKADYRQWSATVYKKYISAGMMEQGTATIKTEDGSGLNDGSWHTFAFEWRTDTENGDNAVQYYVDGVPSVRIEGYTPEYTATFWMGAWFPDNPTWIGSPEFETAFMYIDYVRITPYADPIKTGARGSFDMSATGTIGTNLGSNPLPENNYIANGNFQNLDSNNKIVGWLPQNTNDVLAKTIAGLTLAEGKGAYQIISGQYVNTSYKLSAKIDVTGSGTCKVYVVEYFGTVKLATSTKLEFTESDRNEKTLDYTITKSNASVIRVYVETESGTTAVVKEIKLVRKGL